MKHPASLEYFNVFAEGQQFPALASVELPSIVQQMEDYTTGAISGTIQIPRTGQVEAMEATIKTRSVDPAIEDALQYDKRANLDCYGSYKVKNGETGEVETRRRKITLGCILMERSGDSLEKGRTEGAEYKVAVAYYREEIDGEEIYEISPLHMIFRHRGRDLLEGHRANIGL